MESTSLVVLLLVFAAIGFGVLVYAVTKGSHYKQGETLRVAHAPKDYPEIEWNVELLPGLEKPAKEGEAETFSVPSPPFSEDVFPCSDCHEDMDPNPERRVLEMAHEEIVLDHGPKSRWCFDCHNLEDRDKLRLVSGSLVDFKESYKLCGQCHGTIYRDWREGIHGRRRGYWNGHKSYLLCAHCHNPHKPRFKPLKPLAPPIRPSSQHFTEPSAEQTSKSEGGHS